MNSSVKDLTGAKIGKLTVVKDSGRRGYKGQVIWICKCDCGKEKEIIGSSLRKKNPTKSCGCIQKKRASEYGESITKNIVGKKFGRLVILEILPTVKTRRLARCKCDCGKIFVTRTDKIKYGGTVSCGCYNREMSSLRKGKLSYSYNPNISDEERVCRRTLHKDKLNYWRKQVFGRDGYKCKVCGENGHLNAHHLDGYHWCEEKRFDVDNGVTLCQKHHRQFHKIYGTRNNTKSQFDEYTKNFNFERG